MIGGGLAFPEEVLRNPAALLTELWAERTVDDDVDGGVDNEEEVAHARQVVGPFWKGLLASAERNITLW